MWHSLVGTTNLVALQPICKACITRKFILDLQITLTTLATQAVACLRFVIIMFHSSLYFVIARHWLGINHLPRQQKKLQVSCWPCSFCFCAFFRFSSLHVPVTNAFRPSALATSSRNRSARRQLLVVRMFRLPCSRYIVHLSMHPMHSMQVSNCCACHDVLYQSSHARVPIAGLMLCTNGHKIMHASVTLRACRLVGRSRYRVLVDFKYIVLTPSNQSNGGLVYLVLSVCLSFFLSLTIDWLVTPHHRLCNQHVLV